MAFLSAVMCYSGTSGPVLSIVVMACIVDTLSCQFLAAVLPYRKLLRHVRTSSARHNVVKIRKCTLPLFLPECKPVDPSKVGTTPEQPNGTRVNWYLPLRKVNTVFSM